MKFELTEQDLIIMDKALQQMPYGMVVNLINKINSQIVEQKEPLQDEEKQ